MTTGGPESQILIVGAGVFGLSTASHLLNRGYKNVTVIDRSPVLPAPDAASTDKNKIVRSSYADPFYTALAREAIAAWKVAEEWGDTYHESGVYCAMQGQDSYIDEAYKNDIAQGARVDELPTPRAVRSIFPADVNVFVPDNARGFLNHDGGWAFASQGVERMMAKVTSLGGKIIPGKAAVELLKTDGKAAGVRCADGSVLEADLVVLAVGSWTASAFPELGLDGQCLATGQTVTFVQLTPEEADRYRQCPVYLDFHSGFYIFPPNHENIMKLAIHTGGFVQKIKPEHSDIFVSTPRTVVSDGIDGLRIPKSSVRKLRSELANIYPDLAKKPFSGTRLCWYTDSTNDDWVIGAHPDIGNVFMATSGSGHAYKFLPNIGRLVADAIEGKLPPELVKKFAVNRLHEHDVTEPEVRLNPPAELILDELCTPEDLLPA
ncbi:FAD dependent oxidoreductase [Cerioporus squamosus]|nr:FAD dependent oxidoreductase [Cerioporus squamosus]